MKTKQKRKIFNRIIKSAAPPPALTVSQWADKYRKLSSETSAEPGQWNTDRAPYQREIMDAVNDPEVEEIVAMTSAQIGKSEILNNIAGYYIDIDPCAMLMIQPTIEMAQDYSKRRLAPMIRDTEALAAKVSDAKTRDINNTILMKMFPGGSLALAGANSPAGLASRNIRVVMADEIDRYPVSAGTEGDPVTLAEKRTTTFWNKKKIYTSTPTIKGASRIEVEYEKGTQEKWCIKCPGCGDYQYITLYGTKFQHKKDECGNYTVWDIKFQCSNCLEKYDEYTWKAQPGTWVSNNPEVKRIRSFMLNAFVSPWVSWEDIIKEWLTVKHDSERYKVFKNTMLGETWEEKGDIEDFNYLLERREEYDAELPEGVLLLTSGVDVQEDRLEYEVVGWGKGEQSWGIEYGIIMGSPEQKSTWQILSDKLSAVYHYKNKLGMFVACTCVDSGGHFTSEVYKFCKANEQRRIFAIKGQGGPGIPLIHRLYRSKKENAAVIILGVDSGKSKLMSRLKIKELGDGYCHFPKGEQRGYDQIYFKGLISEHLVKRKSQGQWRMVWEKINSGQRNEPLDVRNYAQAALELVKPNFEELEKRLKERENGSNENQKPPQKRPKKRYGVVNKGVSA
jgi:phage terminase large subunit GpA-like protein